MTARNLELVIGRLVLPAVVAGDRFRIAEAVQRELTRLLALPSTGSLMKSGTVESLDLGVLDAHPEEPADAIGIRLARVLHSGFTREHEPADQS